MSKLAFSGWSIAFLLFIGLGLSMQETERLERDHANEMKRALQEGEVRSRDAEVEWNSDLLDLNVLSTQMYAWCPQAVECVIGYPARPGRIDTRCDALYENCLEASRDFRVYTRMRGEHTRTELRERVQSMFSARQRQTRVQRLNANGPGHVDARTIQRRVRELGED